MTARFTVLASGSSGNAALLEADGFGLLIDCGLAPRFLSGRLAAVGASWEKVHAVILTHTHGDHWKDVTLAQCRSRRIPVYAHPAQFDRLNTVAESFDSLRKANLTRTYDAGQTLTLAPGLTCRPVWVSHDADPTFALRLDFDDGGTGPAWSVGYASDLGVGSEELVAAFAGVDVLALEYNHDETMERNSSRPWHLVARVLGDKGHLSNAQAADLTRAIAARSGPGFPSHLVQLHLSRDCNHPHLAECAGRRALAALNPSASVVTAKQDTPARSIYLSRRPDAAQRATAREVVPVAAQPTLPGFDAA
ncbi:MAG TPA: MBL fold metallo-hydrolase [Gemmataceae bacterium]|nr:MBL fold metallo-hydrolase [Gemmataceae bacterium]